MKNFEVEHIVCAVPWYYSMTREDAIIVKYAIRMKDPVDYDALRKAVDITMTRYPYLCKQLIETSEEYLLIHNDRPVVIKEQRDPINVGGPEANFHQFAIAFYKNFIYMYNTHAIFDGRGRGPMLHTLMYYYCTYRYNEEVQMDGVYLAGTEIDPAEYADPYIGELPLPTFEFVPYAHPDRIFRFDNQDYITVTEPHIHRLRINETQFMKCCKLNDGTPNTAITLLMCRAISRFHTNNTLPIVPGVYCDLRNALGVPKTHNSLVSTLDLKFDSAMRDMPFDEQNTVFRAMMMVMSDPSYLLQQQKEQKEFCLHVNSLPTLKEKTDTATAMLRSAFAGHSFLVSYSGKTSYGSCDKHISSTLAQPYGHGFGILIEITAADGFLDIDFCQEFKEDVYFGMFLKELMELGVDFDLLYSAECKGSHFEF